MTGKSPCAVARFREDTVADFCLFPPSCPLLSPGHLPPRGDPAVQCGGAMLNMKTDYLQPKHVAAVMEVHMQLKGTPSRIRRLLEVCGLSARNSFTGECQTPVAASVSLRDMCHNQMGKPRHTENKKTAQSSTAGKWWNLDPDPACSTTRPCRLVTASVECFPSCANNVYAVTQEFHRVLLWKIFLDGSAQGREVLVDLDISDREIYYVMHFLTCC
ncbi:uncharacterized protein [Oryctolagus cuniculus]|uniref:uncharacterized protein n=1 Tax=Oryctolagus cuniculus TaxID=9986 RepID=UPI0038793DDD